MPKSQNGWIANDASLVSSQLVPGTLVRLSVRKDAAGQLLLEVASAFDRLVQDIDNARGGLDDWGFAVRPIRGGSTLSNHASGTAIDLNATKHPLGIPAAKNFTPAQIAQCHRILDVCGGVVRWGGDYDNPARGGVRGSRPDPMHFEINDGRSPAACVVALAAMREFNGRTTQEDDVQLPELRFLDGTPGTPRGIYHWAVGSVQRLLNDRGLGLPPLTVDGVYGEKTVEAVKVLQRRWKLPETGVVDATTWPWVIWNEAPDFATP